MPGRYVGRTDEAQPRDVEFRFLGRGIRDLVVGDRLIAQWIPVRGADVRQMVNGSDLRLSWTGPRDVGGAIARRRRGRTEVTRFTAAQRFRGLAA